MFGNFCKTSVTLSFLLIHTLCFSQTTNLFPKIPFNIQGMNLCEFTSAYSHTRLSYMREMIRLSKEITNYPTHQTYSLLNDFNDLYEKNLSYSVYGLGQSLETSFKSYLESFYKKIKPRKRHLVFNQKIVDIFIFGHYSLSPNCSGQVYVSLEFIAKNGISTSFQANGPVQTVMSKLASQIFEKYQRTQFPVTIHTRRGKIELIGAINHDIGRTKKLQSAQDICASLDARLPIADEYKMINSLGSWSGGISLKAKAWALNYPNYFQKIASSRRSPIRNIQFLGDEDIYYICVR